MGSATGGEALNRRLLGLRFLLPLFVAILIPLSTAAPAQATFHLIKVREVFPGNTDNSYVELQMFAAGQNFLGTHSLTLYNAAGGLVHTSTFPGTVPNGENQRTVLVGDTAVQSSLGVTPNLVDAGLAIAAAGGAVCWNAGGLPADCVAWGSFSGGATLQSATGTSVGTPASPSGIGAGKAIRRSIEPGCSTLLEESDDSDSSSADFKEVTPAPRNNASAITETTCAGAPNTAIDDRPPPRSNSANAKFTYEAPTGASYECKLDAGAFAPCPPDGQEYTSLAEGNHVFQVRGVNASGPDPTPASYAWIVDTVAPTATIDTHPANPGPGTSAAFTFHASESSTFQCSLVPTGQADSFSSCASGKTYASLGDGEYTFKVRPIDLATNLGGAAAFGWVVDNSLADTTPPQTTITVKPSDPSLSSAVSFGYESNEPGSSFECSLDGAPFAACPAIGSGYSGLANGPHSFQVRAIDSSANVDPTPAGYSFSVDTPSPPAPSLPGTPAPLGPAPAPVPVAAPQTTLSGKPGARIRDRTPSLRFSSNVAGASFECAVDGGRYRSCRSPFTTKPLKPGAHTVSVRARSAGLVDASPARASFRVEGKSGGK